MNKARQVAIHYHIHNPSVEDTIPNLQEKKVVKPKKGCGCQRRKEWLNKKIPGSGDLVEKVTTVTGIKGLVDYYFTESEQEANDTQERHHQESV